MLELFYTAQAFLSTQVCQCEYSMDADRNYGGAE